MFLNIMFHTTMTRFKLNRNFELPFFSVFTVVPSNCFVVIVTKGLQEWTQQLNGTTMKTQNKGNSKLWFRVKLPLHKISRNIQYFHVIKIFPLNSCLDRKHYYSQFQCSYEEFNEMLYRKRLFMKNNHYVGINISYL